MAETIDLDTKREAERRLALLALAGEQAEPSGSCLDAEQLACLVEGRLNAEQVEVCQAHLAGCEHCYSTWRQLDQEWQQQAASHRGRIVPLFNRPGFLAATGSFLAIAASIAVFLNLTIEADRQTLLGIPEKPAHERALTVPATEPANQAEAEQGMPAPSSPESTGQQPAEEQTAASLAEPAENRKKKARSRTDRAQPAEQKTTAPVTSAARAVDQPATVGRAPEPVISTTPPVQVENAAADRLMEKKEKATDRVAEESAPAPAPPPQAVGMAGAGLDKSREAGPSTLADWHHNIRVGCQRPPARGLVADLIAQGQQLLAGEARPPLSAENRQQIQRILTLLADQRQTAEQRCQALLELLDAAERGDKK
jgi:hypothetical protein